MPAASPAGNISSFVRGNRPFAIWANAYKSMRDFFAAPESIAGRTDLDRLLFPNGVMTVFESDEGVGDFV